MQQLIRTFLLPSQPNKSKRELRLSLPRLWQKRGRYRCRMRPLRARGARSRLVRKSPLMRLWRPVVSGSKSQVRPASGTGSGCWSKLDHDGGGRARWFQTSTKEFTTSVLVLGRIPLTQPRIISFPSFNSALKPRSGRPQHFPNPEGPITASDEDFSTVHP